MPDRRALVTGTQTTRQADHEVGRMDRMEDIPRWLVDDAPHCRGASPPSAKRSFSPAFQSGAPPWLGSAAPPGRRLVRSSRRMATRCSSSSAMPCWRSFQPRPGRTVGQPAGTLSRPHRSSAGAPHRLDFTVIGPAVNRASPLLEFAKRLDCQVIVSHAVAREVDQDRIKV